MRTYVHVTESCGWWLGLQGAADSGPQVTGKLTQFPYSDQAAIAELETIRDRLR